ncbi:MAG: benzoate-CoA ligase family protein [Ectothiorhodospiraceae bacterium]|nr:benzoate-CoA ligase family protein [Ectothiorhodospiraceae bacterium]MCH8503762.1 benzoate-CoA ligase family protein [Ectothiorhodospiraceae bacterium]
MNAAAPSVPKVPAPSLEFPREYNAATDFIDSHLAQGRGGKTAVIDDAGSHTYAQLAENANRVANALSGLGLAQEDRVAMLMLDTVAFPSVFWGAIKAGIVPIPINTLLTTENYRHILGDSRAKALLVSSAVYDKVEPLLDRLPALRHVIIDGDEHHGHQSLSALMQVASNTFDAAPTTCDDVAFWLYSSGSTGNPKGVRHLHSHLRCTAELYGRQVLDIREDDVIFSAAKLFFAYGLGNGMSFPFGVGATAVLMAERPTPAAVMRVMHEQQPTIFCGVPTLYAAVLADPGHGRETGSGRLRRCISAGEALPAEVGKRWEQRFGAEILDGVGSTEMLHIFLSNRPGNVHYGSSGTPVPGYSARLVDENDNPVPQGEVGELLISGPTAADGYWNQRQKSLNTFMGPWTRTGDKYFQDAEGVYHYCGRSDDMLKVSGNWVSPFEVESTLIEHESVLEAAVISHADSDDLIKPKAYVVLKDGIQPSDALCEELQQFVKSRVAPWKYPRWIEFIDALPKTATGKVQRFKLRQQDDEA